jgi:hypothetical protein
LELTLFAASLTYLVISKNLSKSPSQYIVVPNKFKINNNIKNTINIKRIIFII